MQPAYIVEVGPETSFHPIDKNEVYMSILPESNQPCNHESDEVDSNPSKISSPSTITVDSCHHFVTHLTHPTTVQTRIRDKIFKPLRLPYYLHP